MNNNNNNHHRLLLTITITLTLSILTTTHSTTQSQTPPNTIYTLLTTNALPTGLFPTGITNFTTTHQTTNQTHFTLYLNSSCSTKFETSVKFSVEVSGVVRYGEIVNLTGVVTQDLFLWFPVKGIHVDVPSSGVIYFDVGVVWKRFAVALFEYPRECVEGEGEGGEEGEMVVVKERARGEEDKSEGILKQHREGDEQRAVA